MPLRRHLLATAASAVLALSVSAPALAQTVLKASDVHPAGYPNVVAIENLGKKLEAASAGRYKLQMFPGGVLGHTETELWARWYQERERRSAALK